MSPRIAMLLLLASVLLHFPSHPADFSYDDADFVEQNASIRTLSDALSSFQTPFPPEDSRRGLYRPITAISYAFDHQLYGMDAWGYHLSNTLLYAIVVLLVARLAFRYSGSLEFSLMVGILFSLHPVHSEVVDSVSGRSELLALLFCLASLLRFLAATANPGEGPLAWTSGRHKPALGALSQSLLFYALACLSKETGVVLPGILAVHLLVMTGSAAKTRSHSRWKRTAALLVPYALVLIAYLALRVRAIGHFSPSEPILAGVSAWGRLHTAGAVFSEYLRLLVFPNILQVDFYYQGAVGILNQASAISICGLLAISSALAGWLFLARRTITRNLRSEEEDRLLTRNEVNILVCACALFFFFLLPVSHIFDIGALMAERFLFAPSLGFILAAVVSASAAIRAMTRAVSGRTETARAFATAALVVTCVFAGHRSADRAAEWRDDVGLWESAARLIENDDRVHSNLGQAYIKNDQLERAEAELTRALDLHPQDRSALGNLALVYWKTERFEDASHSYRAILDLNPEDPMTWNNLGVIEARQERHAKAVQHFEQALRFNPNFALARKNLARSRELLKTRSESRSLDVSAN